MRNLIDIDDVALAKAVVALDIGHRWIVEIPGAKARIGYSLSNIGSDETDAEHYVRDWHVAGKLIERVIEERGYDDIQPGPEVSDSVARDFILRAVTVLTK